MSPKHFPGRKAPAEGPPIPASVVRAAYRVEEAAAILGIGRTNIFRLMGLGVLGSIRIGRRRLIPALEIQAFIKRVQDGEVC